VSVEKPTHLNVDHSQICAEWIEFIKTFNVQGRLDTYPGSPLVVPNPEPSTPGACTLNPENYTLVIERYIAKS